MTPADVPDLFGGQQRQRLVGRNASSCTREPGTRRTGAATGASQLVPQLDPPEFEHDTRNGSCSYSICRARLTSRLHFIFSICLWNSMSM
jgi:hypothetical protein